MNERVLKSDPQIKATGLNPEQVAKHCQAIQIYNSKSQKYVRVDEASPKLSETSSSYVSVDEDYRGGGKRFLLESLGENDYYIKSLDNDGNEETGYLYVSEHVSSGIIESSACVLQSEKVDKKKELFIFEFLEHSEQKGIYKIRCKENGKVLFASHDNYVKADARDREKSNCIWFQLSLKPHMDINVSVSETNSFVLSGSDEPPMYIDEITNNSNHSLKHSAETGMERLRDILAKVKSNKNTALKADSQFLGSTKIHSSTPIEPFKRLCVSSSITMADELAEQQLEIEFKGKKFDGYKVICKASSGSTSIAVKENGIEEASNN